MRNVLTVFAFCLVVSCGNTDKKYDIFNDEMHSKRYMRNKMEAGTLADVFAWSSKRADTTLIYTGTHDMKYLVKNWRYYEYCESTDIVQEIQEAGGRSFSISVTPPSKMLEPHPGGKCQFFISLLPE